MSGTLSVLNLSHNNLSLSATDRRPSINILPNHVVEFPVSDVQFDVAFLEDLASYLTRGVVEVLLDGSVLTAQNLGTLQDISELVDASTFVPEMPGTLVIEVDGSRTDLYTADGTSYRPYKLVEDGISAANVLATSLTPCVVHVASGVYNVVPITIGPYVRVQGSGWSVTQFKASDLTTHFITMSPTASIRDVAVYGPTSAFQAGIYVPISDPKAVSITEVQFNRGYYGLLASGVLSVIARNVVYGYKGPGSEMQTLVRLEAGAVGLLNSITASGPDESIQYGVFATGTDTEVTLWNFYHTCFGAATVGVGINDDATIRLLSGVFVGGHTAIQVGNAGASRVRSDGALIHRSLGVPSNYTHDIDIQAAAASVVYSSGFMSRDKINNPFDAELFAQFVNHESSAEGGCVLGEFYVGEHADAPFPMLKYTQNTSLTGLVSGGEVTRGAGLVLDVAGGSGYVNDGSTPIAVTWVPGSVTLGANQQREYVYVTAAGLISHSTSTPGYMANIVLARAKTGAATVDLLTQDEVSVTHTIARQADYLEHTVGPLMETGCATLLGGSGGLKLRVSSGVFWVGLSERAVVGGDDITFTGWYRSGSNWVTVPGMTEVDDEQWDDGSGALQPVTGGKYTNATLYIARNASGDEYHVVYGQAEFASQGAAEAGALPLPPNVLKEYCCRSAAIVTLKSSGVIASFVDVRPQIGQFVSTSGGVSGDHALLINLAVGDPHPQYQTPARELAAHALYTGAHVTSGDAHAHTGGAGAQITHADLANSGTTSHANIDVHVGSTSNPHAVTAAQAGAIATGAKGVASGVASLNGSTKVVEDPANATATPTANKIPIADASALLDGWVSSGAAAATPALRAIGTGALDACAGNDARLSDDRTPTSTLAHKASHTTGSDIIDTAVAGVSPGLLSASDKTKLDSITSDAAAATASLRTLGTTATSACAGDDARLSNDRTPTAHKDSHISGTDQLDDATALAHGLMTAAQFTKLAGIATGATVNVYGNNYQTAISLARSTYNTNTNFQNKVTLTTAALTGTYRVGWTAVIDGSQTNQNVEAQLYNNTDAAILGVVQVFRPTNAAERVQVGGFAEVVFTGAAKDFIIQYRTANTASTVGIADARIEFYRVV